MKAKLAESGIRYVRDSARSLTYDRANDLYNSLGIKTNMVTGRRSGPEPAPLDPTQIDEELNEIKTQALAATVSLESPNEYDLEHGSDTEWVARIKNYSYTLYTKAKADEMLRHLPVIGPSLTSLEAYEAVGNADEYIDYVNLHMYEWSYCPGFPGWDNNGSHSITWYLNELARQQSPSGKPVQSTEAGYHNDIKTGGLSEEAEGKYTARMFAEFFRRGVYRTCKYELTNQDIPTREGVFGLLRIDLSEKPSFRAVKNLITILTDKGPSFEPGTLNYVLSGSMDNVRQILFQKRNDDFYLMVWVEVPSWNSTTLVDIYPPPQEVVLTLQDSNRISSATLYVFNNTADVNTFNLTINNNQVTFNATDKISIIKLSNSTNSISHGLYRLTPKNTLHSCLGFNQQWIIEPVDDGFHRLISQASGRVLGVDACNTNNRDVVQSYDWLKSDCQKWKFELLPNGYYRVISKHTPYQCLDVLLCSPNDNTKVRQLSRLNTDCEHWKLDWIAPTV